MRDLYIVITPERVYGPFPEQSTAKSWIKGSKVINPWSRWAVVELDFQAPWSSLATHSIARVIGKIVASSGVPLCG